MKLRTLALGGMVAALYAALTVLLAPLSYGPVQLRFSEGLTLLPYFLPEAVPGLAAGCLIANLFGGYGAVDVVVGTGATLLAGVHCRRNRPIDWWPHRVPWAAALETVPPGRRSPASPRGIAR